LHEWACRVPPPGKAMCVRGLLMMMIEFLTPPPRPSATGHHQLHGYPA
jgi:hypothetical protein